MNNYIMDEIRMYFEMINEIKPESILDLNMYLARLGAITRKYQDIYISDEIYMIKYMNMRISILLIGGNMSLERYLV